MPSVSRVCKLRNQVTFKSVDLSADTYGGFTKANASYFTAWANFKPKNSTFKEMGEQGTSPQTFDVEVRYRSDKTSLDTSYIMTFNSIDYDIISVRNDNNYNDYWHLVVKKNVAT